MERGNWRLGDECVEKWEVWMRWMWASRMAKLYGGDVSYINSSNPYVRKCSKLTL